MSASLLATAFAILLPAWGHAQTNEQLAKGAADTANVLDYGLGCGQQRYSPLDQINKDTVRDLVPAWNLSLDDNRSQESQPLVHNGVLY